ncbi:MAG: mandelate racemase/muconate lactonizing enzyme family protein [Chloroflexi bacterium]|nr:mandelate racemase/muconate lactonizing enzyme family protein [Chloroflexota bacterium]MCL5274647.1 mandelate racemase/muconate lactonizing enzyme family protein [Chloroflexota bacterium]
MKIESVDFFYLSIPEVQDIGDGSQDALLVRVRAGGYEGWGECEAAPLPSIAAFVCPMSHSACKPVAASVLGQPLDDRADIARINQLVRRNSLDLLQADHTLSGIDVALWDLLGKRLQEPVYRLLGYKRAYPKTAYASVLFGDTVQETLDKARRIRSAGYRAAKFGWGPFGLGSVNDDEAQVRAARAGLGSDVALLVDAGTVWGEDVSIAAERLPVLAECKVGWLEEPFVSGALHAYAVLAATANARTDFRVRLAGGEGAHDAGMARNMIDHAGISFVQIDTGRVGGITSATEVARYARARGVTFVNHTFTTPLALSASLQPFAGIEDAVICEYPVEASALARDFTHESLSVDAAGQLRVPERPGLGMSPHIDKLRQYLVPVEIRVKGRVLYQTPEL